VLASVSQPAQVWIQLVRRSAAYSRLRISKDVKTRYYSPFPYHFQSPIIGSPGAWLPWGNWLTTLRRIKFALKLVF
jgi:hypothetical protein